MKKSEKKSTGQMGCHQTKICQIVIPEEEENKKRTESILKEIMAAKFPKLRKEVDIQTYGPQSSPNRLNTKRSTLRHTLKLSKVKDKERILKAGKVTYFTHEKFSKTTMDF